MTGRVAIFVTLLVAGQLATAADSVVSQSTTDEHGILVHDVQSPYQSETTQIRVLLPDGLPTRTCHTVYVLPVERHRETRYGDGLLEVKQCGLHNQHQAVFVAPTFAQLPWYADHPADLAIRQETHLLEVVVPFIDKSYPVEARADRRLLVGFSKSGWGAWSLLLRHPDVFGRAAAWDAPLMMDSLGQFGSSAIFGTPENFAGYRISELLRTRRESLAESRRLILLGYGNFRTHHEEAHALLDELMIPHVYRDGPQRTHDWNSGWLADAVGLLMSPTSE